MNRKNAIEIVRRAPCVLMFAAGAFLICGPAGAATAPALVSELEGLGFGPLPGMESLEVPFEDGDRRGRHVIGYLPATAGEGRDGAEAILLGTGLDEEVGIVAAGRIAGATRRHPVIVAFWSREGVVGEALAEARLLACIDLHQQGSDTENRLDVRGAASSPVWPGLLERANVPVGFDLHLMDDSDTSEAARALNAAGVPAVHLRAGVVEATGEARGEVDAPGSAETERLARFAALLVRRLDALDEPPLYVSPESRQGKPVPKKQKPYTGTIPDYTAEVEGLLLSGVMEGGPAEAAGLAEGDVIVEFAGKPINGIYDYRDALEIVEVGRPIQVVFLRDGERREVTVVPTARP